MAQYPINPIEASKQPNGPISTTPIKVVQIQTLGPRQFSAERPDPTPQRLASVGCAFRRACAAATAPRPPQSRLASVHHPSAPPRHEAAISHTFLPWRHIHHASSMPHRRCPSAAKPLSTAPPPRTRPCSAMEPPSTAPHLSPVACRRGYVLPRSYLASTALLCRMESSYASDGEVFALQQ